MANTIEANGTTGAEAGSTARSGAVARLPLRLLIGGIVCGAFLVILLSVSGKMWWAEAWILSGAYFLYFVLYILWGTFRAPELLEERARPGRNAKRWDLVMMRGIYVPLFIGLFVVPALDERFGWTYVGLAVRLAAGVLALASGVWIMWVMDTNRFASGVVRIQSDRDQSVISTGPYSVVRHPMYLGNVALFVAIPIVPVSYTHLTLPTN